MKYKKQVVDYLESSLEEVIVTEGLQSKEAEGMILTIFEIKRTENFSTLTGGEWGGTQLVYTNAVSELEYLSPTGEITIKLK